ncbi:MAG: hypothetical protein VKL39_02640 [Leptolyngbyaceae bacterium]|nr:hypothetical protein [Leptolyngbyaceae bacterium]
MRTWTIHRAIAVGDAEEAGDRKKIPTLIVSIGSIREKSKRKSVGSVARWA